MTYTPASCCRSCGDTELFPVIDLGEQPLANAYRRPDDPTPELRFPLSVVGCPTCSLVQLAGTVDPSVLFDTYSYFSSYSTTMVADMAQLARRMVTDSQLDDKSLVLEVASNDGYLLERYIELGVPTLGIEPASNVAEVAVARGVPTWCEYFTPELAARVVSERGHADVVHANNVMAHIPDLLGFLEGITVVLAGTGVAVIETPHVLQMIANTEFDTIYHEHVFYHSVTAIQHAAARTGLVVSDVQELTVHGGSIRLYVRPAGAPVLDSVSELIARERSAGLNRPDHYAQFNQRVDTLRRDVVTLLHDLRGRDRSIAAYGAAAKGTVLLNHFRINSDLINVVFDRNVHKQGLLMPGTAIPIEEPCRLTETQPDYVLLLAWNLRLEVLTQEAAYRKRGGRFIIPVPQLEILP
jgi:2-polyprenyl-3-methyl-5-hydroxy-6-metoxy-1,4-benzoquinol methylase